MADIIDIPKNPSPLCPPFIPLSSDLVRHRPTLRQIGIRSSQSRPLSTMIPRSVNKTNLHPDGVEYVVAQAFAGYPTKYKSNVVGKIMPF